MRCSDLQLQVEIKEIKRLCVKPRVRQLKVIHLISFKLEFLIDIRFFCEEDVSCHSGWQMIVLCWVLCEMEYVE